jgi:hypothetical protein
MSTLTSFPITLMCILTVTMSRCGFAFQSPAWNNGAIQMVELREVARQSGDTSFTNLLNQVRV